MRGLQEKPGLSRATLQAIRRGACSANITECSLWGGRNSPPFRSRTAVKRDRCFESQHMPKNRKSDSRALVAFLTSYSFEDIAKSCFVLNMWLPNIASQIKSQYLYTILESLYDKLPVESRISDYDGFDRFCEKLLPLLPSFPSMEDYLPENDWGGIKYFFRGKFLRIFYGGDLENTVDFYYSFEVLHSGFDDHYVRALGRSAMEEFESCMSLQSQIIEGIDRSTQEQRIVQPGHIEVPSATFWSAATQFLDRFEPSALFTSAFMREYTKDLDNETPTQAPDRAEFVDRAFEGSNCPYLFLRARGRSFPILPRQSFSVLMNKWAGILHHHHPQIEQEVDTRGTTIGDQLLEFIRERAVANETFGHCSALTSELTPHKVIFATAFRSGDRLVLIYVLPPSSRDVSYEDHLKRVASDLRNAEELLNIPPTRVGLWGRGQMIEFRHSDNAGEKLKPLIITVIPTAATTLTSIRPPNEFPGEIIFLSYLLGIFDELRTLDEFAEFFRYNVELNKYRVMPLNSPLDRFASFRDSAGVLLAGANEPDFLTLDTNWGSNYRFRTLSRFWKVFPEDDFFGHPRSWSIAREESDGEVVLQSRQFTSYIYCRPVVSAFLYVTTPIASLTFEQGAFTDFMMNTALDGFKQYHEDITKLPLAHSGAGLHIVFFPASLVRDNDRFGFVQHLLPTAGGQAWEMDVRRLRQLDCGIRIVFDDERLSRMVRDAKDRSIQVDLLIDIVRRFNEVYGNNYFDSVEAKLIDERIKPNRFRLFAVETRVSFPAVAPYQVPTESDWKRANKTLAIIALNRGVSPGVYSSHEAKQNVNQLRDGLISFLNAAVAEYDLTQAVPILIANVDGLTQDYERKTAAVKNSLSQDVDYERSATMGKDKNAFLSSHSRQISN